MSADKKAPARHFWRDNIEAATMAIILAVMFKYFLVEAYKIPTGSMQPTLLGNEETGIYDRIIVDKLSYHFRDPQRWEVVIFKYPLDRSKNFIKRICGMPGEQFKVEHGDLWTRTEADADWKILRRTKPVQEEVWRRLDTVDARTAAWKPDAQARTWVIHDRESVQARGDGSITLPADGGSILDNYRDGYPGKMGAALVRARRFRGDHEVGDLRVEGSVDALAGCKRVVVELREGQRVYSFEIPGPASLADARPRISVTGLVVANGGASSAEASANAAWRLVAKRSVSFAAQNMDDLLSFEVDGETVAELEVPPGPDLKSSITLRVEGEGADFEDVDVFRDIYYTSGTRSEFDIPPGSYVTLGDNTQDSSDSREWLFAKYRTTADDGTPVVLRGNWRDGENPAIVPGDPEGTRIFFRDEWGELHTFVSHAGQPSLESEPASFVPRQLITGRALIVFWPFVPSLGVWRLKWVR